MEMELDSKKTNQKTSNQQKVRQTVSRKVTYLNEKDGTIS